MPEPLGADVAELVVVAMAGATQGLCLQNEFAKAKLLHCFLPVRTVHLASD